MVEENVAIVIQAGMGQMNKISGVISFMIIN